MDGLGENYLLPSSPSELAFLPSCSLNCPKFFSIRSCLSSFSSGRFWTWFWWFFRNAKAIVWITLIFTNWSNVLASFFILLDSDQNRSYASMITCPLWFAKHLKAFCDHHRLHFLIALTLSRQIPWILIHFPDWLYLLWVLLNCFGQHKDNPSKTSWARDDLPIWQGLPSRDLGLTSGDIDGTVEEVWIFALLEFGTFSKLHWCMSLNGKIAECKTMTIMDFRHTEDFIQLLLLPMIHPPLLIEELSRDFREIVLAHPDTRKDL